MPQAKKEGNEALGKYQHPRVQRLSVDGIALLAKYDHEAQAGIAEIIVVIVFIDLLFFDLAFR